jgi:hypothetical protein
VSAVQSRPCPPFLPRRSALADSFRDRERAHFVPISDTVRRGWEEELEKT